MDHWREAALLLVGHGSSRRSSAREATARLADIIRERHLFAEVRDCYWREPPFLSLDLVSARRVYVVPNFAGEGVFTRVLLPEKLGLSGPRTRLGDRTVVYCQPVGSHPRLADLLHRRLLDRCHDEGIDAGGAAVLVIAHGSRSAEPSRTPLEVAARLRRFGSFAEVATAFIEQPPFVADWPGLVASPVVFAAPLLISEGMHAREDLPPLFGLSEPSGGPVGVAGRTAWLLPGIGRDPEVVSLILEQIAAADDRDDSAAGK
ncbi:MAG TPA: hypothetical protein HPQ04_01445 [Rhodospirillaceae bacterium]|nr:hypothetical protein [Rhodospirillaceae bacterium]